MITSIRTGCKVRVSNSELLPKLTLLAAARQRELAGGIPVLCEGSSEVMRKVSESSFSSRFWVLTWLCS
jgi:hypothetical protein